MVYSVSLEIMVREIEKNRIREDRGFPVVATILNPRRKKSKILTYSVNKKSELKNTNSETHCEFLCLTNHNFKNTKQDNLTLMISLPPCFNCLEIIKKAEKIKRIYFLFDPRGKTNKKYIKNTKDIEFIQYIPKNNIEEEYVEYLWQVLSEGLNSWSHYGSIKHLKEKHGGELQRIFPS